MLSDFFFFLFEAKIGTSLSGLWSRKHDDIGRKKDKVGAL